MIGTLKVFKSCDACKARKVRCIGHGYPGPCEACMRRNVECHFSVARAPQKRNRINRAYRELTKENLSTVFGSSNLKQEDTTTSRRISVVPAESTASRADQATDLNLMGIGTDDQQSAKPNSISPPAAVSRLPELYIDRLLADRRTPQRLKDEKFPFKGNGIFGGDYSAYSLTFFSESRMLSLSTRLGNNKVNELLGKVASIINSRMKSIEKVTTDSVLLRNQISESVEDRTFTSTCIKSYFEQVHPLYPFIDRNVFEETTSSHQFPQLLSTNKAWSALYYSVLALGSQYNDCGSFEPGKKKAWQLFSVALALFPDLLILQDSLIALQAITAMAIFALSVSCIHIEYIILSEGARRAQNLGYNRATSSLNNVCDRTFWVLYSLEKMTSFYSGRSSVLMDSDIGCPIPYAPEAVFGDFDWFLAFARYARLLSRVYTSLFSISVAANSLNYYCATIDQLNAELERWRMSLPPSIRPGEPFRAHTLPGPLTTTVALRVHYLYYNLLLALSRAALHIGVEETGEDISRTARQLESKKTLIKTSRSILELTKYIDVETYTPVWVIAGIPLAALFVLFDLVIHNPTHPETSKHLALLDVASGHFSRIEYASGGSIPGWLIAEFAHIAREYVKEVQRRGPERENTARWSGSALEQPESPYITTGLPAQLNSSSGRVAEPELSEPTDALFFPLSDDPYYMPEGLLMGTDVMDLFGSAIPGIDPNLGLNDVTESWAQGFFGFNS